jgi:hypothetical protein
MDDIPNYAGSETSRDVVKTHLKTILQQAGNRKYAAPSILLKAKGNHLSNRLHVQTYNEKLIKMCI